MSTLSQAGESVQHLAKQYASVIQLGEFLTKIGSLENLEAEITARVSTLREDEATALAALREADQKHAQAVEHNKAFVAASQEEVTRAVEAAKAEVSTLVDAARQEAEAIRASAKEREAEAVRFVEEQQATSAILDTKIIVKREELVTLQQSIAALRQKFA